LGVYRFLLAIGVVAFHVGGGWVIGRAAVFAFYFVSGFLISRVLDTSYRGGVDRLAAFYCKRALRLLPLYLVIAVMTLVAFSLRGSTAFLVDGKTIMLLDKDLVGGPWPNWSELLPWPTLVSQVPIPMISGAGPDVIPQAWSIGVEIAFYLIAPILVLLARRNVWPLVALAVLGTGVFLAASFTAPDFLYLDNNIYKNAYTSAFMFFWGAVIYALMRDRPFRIPFAVGAPIVVLALYYFYAWSTSKTLAHDPSPNAFIANILLLIPLSAVVCLTVMPQALRRWESRLGDLSYGIYLNHFLVAGLLLWLAETIGGEPFGHYGRPAFVLLVMAACALLATVTFNLSRAPGRDLAAQN
jgi:peptidoglycan/LPS O-acetylase OafA/YrhL